MRARIAENARLSSPYLLMNALAAVVASYGLLQNSVAVIIGAMIIATLLGPIKGMTQASSATLQTQNQLMTARGLLYQAALALDAAKPADAGAEGKLVPIRQAVTATKINVAEDLEAQRSGLLDLASQVDGLTQ